MELKKKPELNLEKQKVYRFQIGIVLGLALSLVAFEWSTTEFIPTIDYTVDLGEEEERAVNYKIIPEKIPELKEPKKKPSDQIKIVEDIVKVVEPVEKEPKTIEPVEGSVDGIKDIDEGEEVFNEDEIFTIVEEMPSFIGGEEGMYKYLRRNIKFPYLAKDAGIQGVVYLTFVIMEDGSISDVRVLRGIGAGCDEEAVRVIKKMPKWKAGKQRGRPVRVQFNMPINFKLKRG